MIKKLTRRLLHHYKHRPKRSRTFLIGASLILLVAGSIAAYLSFFRSSEAGAAWYDDDWSYRQKVTITNSGGTALTDFQVNTSVDTSTLVTAGKLQSDCDDIRVTDINGAILPHWIEKHASSACNSTTTKIWTKTSTIPAAGTVLYVYYGNPSTTNAENGKNVFVHFDNFDDNSIDYGMWSEFDAATGITESSGKLQFVGTNAWDKEIYVTTPYARGDYSVEFDYQWTSNNASVDGLMFGWRDNSALGTTNTFAQLVYAYYNHSSTTCTTCTTHIYEDGTSRGDGTGSWVQNTIYKVRVRTRTSGGAYYEQSTNGGATWTTSYTSTYSTEANLHPGFALHTGSHNVDNFFVRKDVVTAPTTAVGGEEKSPGPIGHWKFDEGVDNTCSGGINDTCDSTSNANDGAITGAAWKTADLCITGNCLYFDGTDDVVNIGDQAELEGLSAVSLSFWIKVPLLPVTTEELIGKESVYKMQMGTTGQLLFLTGNNWAGSILTTTTALQPNQWYHVVATYDGTTKKVYINGIQDQSTVTTSGSLPSNTTRFSMGAYDNAGSFGGFMQMFMDEPKVYNFARTADQVKTDYIKGAAAAGSGAVLGKTSDSVLSNGLVGYWNMDETSGNALDASGNSQTMTDTNTVARVTGKFGNAGDFEADVPEYFTRADSTALSLTTQMTLSAWVKVESLTSQRVIVAKDASTNNQSYHFAVGSNGLLRLLVTTDGATQVYQDSVATLSTGTWYHVAAVYNGSTQKIDLYINGAQSNGTITNGPIPSTIYDGNAATRIGHKERQNDAFDGLIDEARLYNRSFSPSEIQQLYNWAPGPVGYWDMNENTGTTARDTSTNSNIATWTGSAAHWQSGKYGSAGVFAGATDYATASDSNSLDLTTTMTFEAWVNPSSLSNALNQIFIKNNANTNFYGFGLTNTGVVNTQLSGRTAQDIASTATVSTNTWSHVAATYDGSNVRFYINGILVTTTAATGGTTATAANLDIGRDSVNSGRGFNGRIDEIRIYNYARTSGQIVEDMNAGHPIGGSPIGSQVAYWSLDEQQGQTANNRVSTSYGGTLGANSTASTDDPTWKTPTDCKFNGCASFDGADYISLGDIAAYKTDTKTVSFWAKPSGTISITTPIFSASSANWYVGFTATNNMIASYADSTPTQQVAFTTSGEVTPLEWHHYTYVFSISGNNVTISFYKDGKFLSTTSFTSGYSSSYGTAGILGAFTSSSLFFTGVLDEIKLYNTALTPDQILLDMNAGAAINAGTGTIEANQLTDTAGNPPISHWNFNENTGTSTVADTSGNGNTGTMQSMAATDWVPGKFGSALNFDGTNNYVSTTTAYANPTNFSISVWFKTTTASGRTIVAFENAQTGTGTTSIDRAIYMGTDGKVRFYIYNGATQYLVSTNTLNDGLWHHVVATHTSANANALYVDGVLQTTLSAAAASYTGYWRIGSYKLAGLTAASDGYFTGAIDEVKIYNYARTQAQVAYDYNRGAPVGWWKFDECQGLTAYDASGKGNNGTITPGASSNTSANNCTSGSASDMWADGATGKFNSALGFDGGDDYVFCTDANCGGTTKLDRGSNSWSMSAWIKTSQTGLNQMIASKSNSSGNKAYEFYISSGNVPVFLIGNTADGVFAHAAGSKTITDGNWHHVMGTFDVTTNTVRIYTDGRLDGTSSGTTGTAVTDSNAQFEIGRYQLGGNLHFNGLIDDVRVYNYASSLNQVLQVMNGGSSLRFGPSTGSP